MLRKHDPKLLKYLNMIITYSKHYDISAAYIAAALISEGKDKGSQGLADITDGILGKFSNRPMVYGANGQVITVFPGQKITRAMKDDPSFAIAYMAWRVGGQYARYGWPGAFTRGYDERGQDPGKYIPQNYVPSSSNAGTGVSSTQLANATRGISATADNPFVVYDKKTHSIHYTTSLGPNVMMFEGVPVTRSILQREVQDKAGLGGDYYNFTGRMPNPKIVAALMASGKPIMQLENHWINDQKNFKNSPAGKKYEAGYQDAWSQIMGKNSPIPWELVQQAARDNLNETEFAAKLRMDGFEGQKDNKAWSYLNSNEYQSRYDANMLSYEKIYGQQMNASGMKTLASDAALAGWDNTQWEAYLRSLPEYTSTREYQGHALDLLNKLGMDFGMEFGLGANGYTPPSGDQALKGPPTDQRVDNGKAGSPAGASDNLGIMEPDTSQAPNRVM